MFSLSPTVLIFATLLYPTVHAIALPSEHHRPPSGHRRPPPEHYRPYPEHHGPPSKHHGPSSEHHGPPFEHHGPPSGHHGSPSEYHRPRPPFGHHWPRPPFVPHGPPQSFEHRGPLIPHIAVQRSKDCTRAILDTHYDGCVHGPTTRSCWTGNFNASTDMDLEWPDTGKTVEYNFVISAKTLAPDGVPKEMMVVNGQYPGPTIVADWGDTVRVSVKNLIPNNGTGLHMHGVRQWGSNHMDGVGGITECPIATGETKVYEFKATQYGTAWYHSHYSVQYADGVAGGIIIRGPATSNYDTDLGVLPFSDWFYSPIFAVNAAALHSHGPPTADNLLINGSMTSLSGGKYALTTLQPGKKHLLRLVNMGINNYVHVSLDGHPFEVIAADFIPIVPYTAESIVMTVGQRYDVIINANQSIGNYWLRVGIGGRCDGPNANAGNIRSIFHYEGADGTTANSTGITLPVGCYDETNIVPFVKTTVPKDTPENLQLGFTNTASADGLVQWLIDGTRMQVDYTRPTLRDVMDNKTSSDAKRNLYTVGKADEWSYWVIQQDAKALPIPHPIHLHGHDFYVLDSAENKTWNGDTSGLKFDNPIRRDTASLPARGYIVIAFEADNPGAWLMHCHIPFHISAGFGLQFLERQDEIISSKSDMSGFNGGCDTWKVHQERFFPNGFTHGDSLVK